MLTKFSFENNALSLYWQDGSADAYTADWLLDNAPSLIYDSGQKAYSILDIPEGPEIRDVRQVDDSLAMEFLPEHQSITCFAVKPRPIGRGESANLVQSI